VRSESSGFAFVNGVTPGGAAVTLRLQPGGRVHLQVRGPGGDVPERCSVDLKAVGGAPVADANVGWVNPEGQADFAAPAGSVTLSVMAPGSKRDITLDVPAGGTVTSAVTLEAEPKDPPSR
jgi:hypothetical protein